MAEFRSKLNIQLESNSANDGRGSWILLSPLVFYSSILRKEIIVPAGFVTDYASVPRLPLMYWLFGDTNHEAAVIHDFLYFTKQTSRKMADRIFKEAAAAIGTSGWRRWLMYAGVRVGGAAAWENSDE